MSKATLNRTETYGYDAQLDQLTSANYGDGNPGQSASWSYDAAGNRGDSVVDALNRATSIGGVPCGSDILGNRTSTGDRSFGWDCLNRLTFVTDPSASAGYALVGQYGYRADGLRTLKYTPNALSVYRYDGQMGIEDEEWSTDHFVTRYGLGARGVDLIERTSSSGTVTAFPIYDAHGNNVASLTRDGSGGYQLGDRRSYDAWGVVRSQQSGGDPKLRYCANLGHKADDETGLVYMRARYYEPGSGRFLSEDPANQGANWFLYCKNNPVGNVDRDGRMSDGEEFLCSVLLFVTGYCLLLNGVVPDLGAKLDHIIWEIKRLEPYSQLVGNYEQDAKRAFEATQKLEAQKARVGTGQALAAIAGYAMVLSALLMDIDLVGSNYDMLATMYGGG